MSAYLVSDATYAALARYMLEDRPDIVEMHLGPRFELGARNFVEVCRLANHKALHALYGRPMPKRGEIKPIDPYSTTVMMSAEDALAALCCIEYQCAETWDGHEAFLDFLHLVVIPLFAQGAKHTTKEYRVGDGSMRTHYSPIGDLSAAHGHWERAGEERAEAQQIEAAKLPDGWREGARDAKIMRRGTLRFLNSQNRLELVDAYHFDDTTGASRHDGAPKPVTLADWECSADRIRQWTNAHGHFVYVRHHSNSNATYRVKPEAAKARAAA